MPMSGIKVVEGLLQYRCPSDGNDFGRPWKGVIKIDKPRAEDDARVVASVLSRKGRQIPGINANKLIGYSGLKNLQDRRR